MKFNISNITRVDSHATYRSLLHRARKKNNYAVTAEAEA